MSTMLIILLVLILYVIPVLIDFIPVYLDFKDGCVPQEHYTLEDLKKYIKEEEIVWYIQWCFIPLFNVIIALYTIIVPIIILIWKLVKNIRIV